MRRRLSRLIRPSPRQEVDEELEFHIEERVREYESRGLDPEAARAAALERMGDLESARREAADLLTAERRTEARRDWLKFSWLDVKLGFRMLVKYPGLTVVGGLAMAFAIWVGAGAFEFVKQAMYPDLPLHEGHRVVGIHVRDAATGGVERRVARELVSWRGQLETVVELGAFRTLDRNLITADGRGEPVEVAEISASGFEVARVPPLLGRTLVPADEEMGASPVVVLGYDVWQGRFAGDPEIVGRRLRLGRSQPTVVGVMPEGFAFPIAQSLWMPLRPGELDQEARRGPGLRLFGRLAPGASLADARAELSLLGQRAAVDLPETHEHLRPEVMPYAKSILGLPTALSLGLASINLFVLILLVLICGNVALLMFARAATREGEIMVRNALGASRGRIIAQLFVEALVLGGIAAAVGLAGAGFGLRWMFGTVLMEVTEGDRLPFWFSDSLSPTTIGYALLLTLVAAGVAGVIPALKVTGREVGSRLRQASAGGGGLRFGGIWTAVIVTQLAVTVAFPVTAYFTHRDMKQIRELDVGVSGENYLSVRLEMDRQPASASLDTSGAPFEDRFRDRTRELEQRLELHSAVAGVTFGERLPGMYHPHRLIELDEGGAAPVDPRWAGYRVSSAVVAEDFFDVLEVPVLSGRNFHPGDLASDSRVILVNQPFVDIMLGGRNPIGRQVRYMYFEGESDFRSREEEPWYEIIGVVPDLGTTPSDIDTKVAALYHPAPAGGVYPAFMAVHVRGNPESLTHELRTLASDVDPGLRLYAPMRLDRVDEAELRFYSFWVWILAVVSGIALTLSLAGIYSVMSFAVSRRTREIGIRVALGGSRHRIMAAIFKRPLVQVGGGLLAGGVLIGVLMRLASGGLPARTLAVLLAYMLAMAAVCALACIVPTRRALAVEPTEALRAE